MNKSLLLATAALALSAAKPGASVAAPPLQTTTVLWNQNSNFAHCCEIVSENFASGSFGTIYNSSAADDFIVPAGKKWKITGVDVTGTYCCCCPPGKKAPPQGCGPATDEIITFYRNKGGLPGAMIGTPQTLNCTDNEGTFACILARPVKLTGGRKGKTYWLGFVANMDFETAREWYWTQTETIHGHEAAWENPGDGFNTCPTWGTVGKCLGYTGDMAFDLRGNNR